MKVFNEGVGLNETLAMLLVNLVMLSTEAILLGFAGQYFKVEQSEGTPFTEKGAELSWSKENFLTGHPKKMKIEKTSSMTCFHTIAEEDYCFV